MQVAMLQKENKSVSNHLKAAQSARAAAQRAASQLREENTALAGSQDQATVCLFITSIVTWMMKTEQSAVNRLCDDLLARLCTWTHVRHVPSRQPTAVNPSLSALTE